jgi:hypothetical protein
VILTAITAYPGTGQCGRLVALVASVYNGYDYPFDHSTRAASFEENGKIVNSWALSAATVGLICLVALLYRDARRPARALPDNRGHELRYSRRWTGFGWVALFLTVVLVLWGLTVTWRDDNLGGVVTCAAIGILFGLGSVWLIRATRTRINVTDDGITAVCGKSSTYIAWAHVSKITPSNLSGTLVIWGLNDTSVKFERVLVGIPTLRVYLKKHLAPELYEKALDFLYPAYRLGTRYRKS